MFNKIANILSIISFLMVSLMSVGAYLAIQYMRSPEFERNLKNKVMGDLQNKMKDEIPKQLPKITGPTIPMSNDLKQFWDYMEQRNKEQIGWETKGKWK